MIVIISAGLHFVSDVVLTAPFFPLVGAVLFVPLCIGIVRFIKWTS